jgi:hypothetical protein
MTQYVQATNLFRRGGLVLAALALAASATAAYADPVIVNGNFQSLLAPGVSSEFGDAFPSQEVTGWSTNGYNFVFTPGTADSTGAKNQFGSAPLQLWGPALGVNNGLPATSPDGGNFIAADGAFNVGAITQSISGLSIGTTYDIGFWFAGAQQDCCTGPTTEKWQVTFGTATQSTVTLSDPSQGFTGWQYDTMEFTATSTTQTLSFLAVGTPDGGSPPFSLLDGVTISATPEPSSLALMATGLFSVGGLVRSRFKKVAA